MMDCPDLAVPFEVMQHVVNVESSRNAFAIGVVGGYLAKQPSTLEEALLAVRQLKAEGYNFSVGIAQVNRYNLAKYGLPDYASAFQLCANLQAGSRILRECYDRAQDWGKAFSCYYSGNFFTGFDHGYVQKIFSSIRKAKYAGKDASKTVRIIPYSSKTQRKLARDESLPIGDERQLTQPKTSMDNAVKDVSYPEPYAIRRYLPSTPLPVTASALARVLNGPTTAATRMPTIESRPEIPVPGPGPGAVMPDVISQKEIGLAGIPVQLVGVGGDPYKTVVLNSKIDASSGSSLPLPNGNEFTGQVRPESSDRGPKRFPESGVRSPKGGELLQPLSVVDQSKKVLSHQERQEESTLKSKKPETLDRSFVF